MPDSKNYDNGDDDNNHKDSHHQNFSDPGAGNTVAGNNAPVLNDPAVKKRKLRNLILRILNIVIVVGFGIYLVSVLLRQVSFEEIKNAIINIYKPSIIAALSIIFISDLFRAYRMQLLVGIGEIRFIDMFLTALIRNAFVMVLPARTGELSYVYVLTKKFKFPVEVGISTMILAMVFDLAIVFSLIVISIIIVWLTMGFSNFSFSSWPVILIASVLLVASMLLLFYLSPIIKFFIKIIDRYIMKKKAGKSRFMQFIFRKLCDINTSIEIIRKRRVYGKVYFYSIICRVLKFLAYYLAIHAVLKPMGYGFASLSFWVIFLATVVAEISAVLPTHALAGFGTYEGAFALAFIALGFSSKIAITVGFSYHLIMLSFAVTLGLISMIIISLPFYRTKNPVQASQLS